MADPVWTNQYALNQTPEQNGFTRVLYSSPVVNAVTTGTPANRRVEITSSTGDAVFVLSNVPSLDISNGATIETTLSCSGSGDAGFELTFQTTHFGIQVYQNSVTVVVADGLPEHTIDTSSNSSDTIIRATVSSDNTLRVYRAGVLVDTRSMPLDNHPLPRVLWWGEAGGTQIFRALKYYVGGAVAP